MADPIATLNQWFIQNADPANREADATALRAIVELERRAELTERSIEWQLKTGGAVIFYADGRVELEWFEAELRSVDGENLAAALDQVGT